MSAKNVRNVSIFHISSCQTTCQGKNPNKLNNNFLIKLNYYFRFIFIWFSANKLLLNIERSKLAFSLADWPRVYNESVYSENDRILLKMTDIGKSRTRNPIIIGYFLSHQKILRPELGYRNSVVLLLRIATKLCEVCAINDVINMGWMVCMNNVQKFFWLWVWQEVWDLAHGLVTKDYYNFGTSNVNEGAGVFQKIAPWW